MKDEIHSLETKLGIYSSQIEDLEKKINQKTDERNKDLLEELKLKQKKFKTQIQLAKEKGSNAWNEVQGGVKAAYQDLKQAVEQASSRF